MDSAPFNYGRQNAQHIAAASIHSYLSIYKIAENCNGGMDFLIHVKISKVNSVYYHSHIRVFLCTRELENDTILIGDYQFDYIF